MKRALLYLLVCSLISVFCYSQTPTTVIKVDQAGYLSASPKIALVSAPGQSFVVKRVSDGATVLHGKLSAPGKDSDTGDTVQAADFSTLKAAGNYYVEVAGVGRSWPFAIGPDVYSRAFYLAMRGFYGQRCGTAVDMGPEFAAYKHPACHLNGEFHESSGKQGSRPNLGGWHDAGDYGRYVVNSGISTGSLLWAYEMFPTKVGKVKLNIPETGNGTPDILNEARFNLEWMLKMQDDDGGSGRDRSARLCAVR